MRSCEAQLKTPAHYRFGDSEPAARRLKLLAKVFEPSTREFILKAANHRRWQLVVDLGCGPGLTTGLIAQTLGCAKIYGLDNSERFLALARAAERPLCFLRHDITEVPLPCGRPDLIFCRFLLTHLADPAGNIGRWATQLMPDGLMLLEEVEAIRTTHPIFAEYLGIVDRLLASQSNQLYAGAWLRDARPPSGVNPVLNDVRTIEVRNSEAAAMFVLNMGTWKEDLFIRRNYEPERLVALEKAMIEIAAEQTAARDIAWEMREVALGNSLTARR